MNLLIIIDPDGGSRTVELGGAGLTLGRAPPSDVRLRDSAVSKQHARIEPADDGWQISDLDSHNGTWLNGQRVTRARLKQRDRVQVGPFHLVHVIERPAEGEIELIVRGVLDGATLSAKLRPTQKDSARAKKRSSRGGSGAHVTREPIGLVLGLVGTIIVTLFLVGLFRALKSPEPKPKATATATATGSSSATELPTRPSDSPVTPTIAADTTTKAAPPVRDPASSPRRTATGDAARARPEDTADATQVAAADAAFSGRAVIVCVAGLDLDELFRASRDAPLRRLAGRGVLTLGVPAPGVTARASLRSALVGDKRSAGDPASQGLLEIVAGVSGAEYWILVPGGRNLQFYLATKAAVEAAVAEDDDARAKGSLTLEPLDINARVGSMLRGGHPHCIVAVIVEPASVTTSRSDRIEAVTECLDWLSEIVDDASWLLVWNVCGAPHATANATRSGFALAAGGPFRRGRIVSDELTPSHLESALLRALGLLQPTAARGAERRLFE